MSKVLVSRAAPADIAACVALLPPVAFADSVFAVARSEAGLLIGAAGIGWQSWGDPPGFPVWVHVLPDRRREGIGRSLFAAVVQLAQGETPALLAAAPLDLEGEAAAFARSAGFDSVQRQIYFRAGARRFLDVMETIVARLRRHGRIPAQAATVALDAANADAVAALIERNVRNAPRDIRSLIARGLNQEPASAPVDVSRSSVLTVEDQVTGALLSQRAADGRNSRIVVNVVTPELRQGWANAVLLEATTRLGVIDDCAWFDFDCADDVRDTIGLARRAEADVIRTDGIFYQAMATAPA